MMEPRRFVVNSLGKVCATGFGISLKIEERILGRTEFWCLATLTRANIFCVRSYELIITENVLLVGWKRFLTTGYYLDHGFPVFGGYFSSGLAY